VELCIPLNRNTLINASVNSSSAHPPPPRATAGHLSRCQSREWGIRNFIAARGLGICVPRGDPRAFDTRVLESAMACRQELEKLAEVFKGMFSQFEIFLHYL